MYLFRQTSDLKAETSSFTYSVRNSADFEDEGVCS